MNGNLNLINSQLTARELGRQAQSWRRAHPEDGGERRGGERPAASVQIRGACEEDRAALIRLARLEGQRPPLRLRVLVAEVEGEVLAALPLNGGEAIADPFRPTAPLVEMLKLRAAQIEAAEQGPHRGLLAHLRGARRRPQPAPGRSI